MATASEFLGLSKKRAQDVAEFKSLVFRLVSVDGERFLGYPPEDETRNDRICVEVEKGAVVKATIQ
jgi:hypothetical protein